jgi:hypothetical protein
MRGKIMQKTINNQYEMGMTEALLSALAVGLLFVFIKLGGDHGFLNVLNTTKIVMSLNEGLLTVSTIVFFINIIALGFSFKRMFFLKKQGERLNKVLGKKDGHRRGHIARFITASMTTVLFAIIMKYSDLNTLISLQGISLPSHIKDKLDILFISNFSCLFFIITAPLIKWFFQAFLSMEKKTQDFPLMPSDKNQVAIGTEGESSSDTKGEDRFYQKAIKWVTIPMKGLNGNILFLGSIGTGKTAGMMIPLVEQVFRNFTKLPSILALDPKANFVKELLTLINRFGLGDKILHLKINGDVTINPIYKENILKDGNFIEVAQNFQAASANFMGKSSESPFWDNSASNLIKNAIAYCGAMYDYFTLKEVYQTLLLAISDDGAKEMADHLEALIRGDGNREIVFDEEEIFNINCSIEFFKGEYNELDKKLKTGIHATATVFMSMFNEFHANRIFCPKKEDLVIKDMSELIDEGKFLIFDVQKGGLARPMGTYVKLLYLQAVLDRGKKDEENDITSEYRSALVLADEYQDLVTAGSSGVTSDVSTLAKGRSKKLIFVAATQAYNSIYNAIGNEKSAKELFQNFRTKICGHSSDLTTIADFKELVYKDDVEKTSHSIGEQSQQAKRNLVMGGFDSENANISESVSTSTQKEYIITARDFNSLKTYEAFGFIYDGISTSFKKIFFKPYYYENKNVRHEKVLADLAKGLTTAMFAVILTKSAMAFPNICSVAKTPSFNSCLDLKVSSCVCGPWFAPRPCARVSYYVPQSFIEVHPHGGTSYFKSLPLAAAQLSSLPDQGIPFGSEDDNGSYSFQAHSIAVPFGSYMNMLPCGGTRPEKSCFDGMSEHLPTHWRSGSADALQPKFLAWGLAPKACLIKGAAMSATGGEASFSSEGGCSYPMDWMKRFLPSSHSTCNGWGTFYPRSGTIQGVNQTTASLMIASRIKSLSAEVFRSMPSSPSEKWQMIYPQSSSCFREGQNMGILEFPKRVNELGRLSSGKINGYLHTIWKRVSCCVDYPRLPAVYGAISIIKSTCQGIGK